jgi:hypothetical protein
MPLLKNLYAASIAGAPLLFLALPASAAVITFDQVVVGQTSFGFDGDADGITDVIFSTTDPAGFNATGPGLNQVFIDEPGLEGTSLLNPDLRVDFRNGAIEAIAVGFALNSFSENPTTFTAFSLFDANGGLLASTQQAGLLGNSTFPEGRIQLAFSGIAAYGLFNFSSDSGRYIIDNFEGTFGSTEAVPEPLTLLGMGTALGLGTLLRRTRKPV